MATKVSQIETASERVLGAGLDSLCKEDKSIHVLNVVTGKHAILKDLEVDVLAIARDVAMVCQSVEAGTGTTSFTKLLAYVECNYTWKTHKRLQLGQSTSEEQSRGRKDTGE